MPQDRRIDVDVTPPTDMDPETLARYAQTLIGKKHADASGKVIGEVRNVRHANGQLIAEIKLSQNVILG